MAQGAKDDKKSLERAGILDYRDCWNGARHRLFHPFAFNVTFSNVFWGLFEKLFGSLVFGEKDLDFNVLYDWLPIQQTCRRVVFKQDVVIKKDKVWEHQGFVEVANSILMGLAWKSFALLPTNRRPKTSSVSASKEDKVTELRLGTSDVMVFWLYAVCFAG